MSRSNWKPVFFDPKLWHVSINKTSDANSQPSAENDLICTKRSTPVLPFMVGIRVHIANGVRLVPITITAEIVAHRRGEFAGTRKRSAMTTSKNTSSTKNST